jgi:hypothetical protein
MSSARTVLVGAILTSLLAIGQVEPIATRMQTLSSNAKKIALDISFDRAWYFPNQRAVVTLTATNTTDSSIEVPDPLDSRVSDIYFNMPPERLFFSAKPDIPTRFLGPHETIALRLELGISSKQCLGTAPQVICNLPSQPGVYRLHWGYGMSAKKDVTIVDPSEVQVAEIEIEPGTRGDPKLGPDNFVRYRQFVRAYILRHDKCSFVCATIDPVAISMADKGYRAYYWGKSMNCVYESPNVLSSLSVERGRSEGIEVHFREIGKAEATMLRLDKDRSLVKEK